MSLQLMAHSWLDGSNQLYSIAFGISDNENDALWQWFKMKLNEAIGKV